MSPRSNPFSPEVRPIRKVLAIATAMVCAAALAAAPATADVDSDRPDRLPKLKGVVGPRYKLSFSETSVPAGTYKVVINDRSTIHNFHLTGPGVDQRTKVSKMGKTVWHLDLTPGTYHGECDPHSDMDDDLVVT